MGLALEVNCFFLWLRFLLLLLLSELLVVEQALPWSLSACCLVLVSLGEVVVVADHVVQLVLSLPLSLVLFDQELLDVSKINDDAPVGGHHQSQVFC